MRNIKGFNENFLDKLKNAANKERDKNFSLSPSPSQDRFNKENRVSANKYLSQFKKDYTERNKAENILVEGLFKLEYVVYISKSLNSERILGAMEAVLILEGILSGDGSFDYKKSDHNFLSIKYTTKESYKEHIIRLSKEYLQSKGVL